MAAPKGNQFWKIRSKHGRDKLFATPKLLWEAATEYFEWCDKNPFYEFDVKLEDKSLQEVKIPKMRPYTLHGLCIYLGCSTDYFRNFQNQDRKNLQDFIPIINQIQEVIYNQKFSGAASGFLNANIIARDLGLADKQDSNVNVKLEQITGMKFPEEPKE